MKLLHNKVTGKYHTRECSVFRNPNIVQANFEVCEVPCRCIDTGDKSFSCNCLKESEAERGIIKMCERLQMPCEWKFGKFFIKSQVSNWILERRSDTVYRLWHSNLFRYTERTGLDYHYQGMFTSAEMVLHYIYRHDIGKYKITTEDGGKNVIKRNSLNSEG